MKNLSFPTIDPNLRRSILVVGGLIVLLAAFRIFRAVGQPDLPNFSPLMAVAFCGGLFLSGAWAWGVPMGALFVSDLGLSLVRGYPVTGWWQVAVWVCFLAAIGFGRWMSRRSTMGVATYFGALVGAGAVFYLVTNAVSWLAMPEYAKTLAGLMQALTTGLPGFPPTWTFFRNSLASDLLFGGLTLGVRALAFWPERAKAVA